MLHPLGAMNLLTAWHMLIFVGNFCIMVKHADHIKHKLIITLYVLNGPNDTTGPRFSCRWTNYNTYCKLFHTNGLQRENWVNKARGYVDKMSQIESQSRTGPKECKVTCYRRGPTHWAKDEDGRWRSNMNNLLLTVFRLQLFIGRCKLLKSMLMYDVCVWYIRMHQSGIPFKRFWSIKSN